MQIVRATAVSRSPGSLLLLSIASSATLSELFPRVPPFPTVRTVQCPPRQLYLTWLPIQVYIDLPGGPPRPFRVRAVEV